ncbi:uncharacterized protein LOC119986634 [Tripterygium wilfordii]|uniref:uncharacterized protein LOC119986634 n=1 Tax=Tripterygium wilfordii TaxID=458696 RepID=UPI0018F83C73|nr:uncharacterized protein LOC119986634 [Tripterygium wilfordii]
MYGSNWVKLKYAIAERSVGAMTSLNPLTKMHRSSSGSRVSDEFSTKINSSSSTEEEEQLELPTYHPLSHVAKKERSRLRSAENAIHFIPLVLFLCVIILWFFSTPESRV